MISLKKREQALCHFPIDFYLIEQVKIRVFESSCVENEKDIFINI